MDPMSITATAVTLIGAATTVTRSLFRLAQAFKAADSRITDLCTELTSLTSFLETVERTLKPCRALDLACVEEDLWRQSELSLMDCQVTLNELSNLVNKVKENSGARGFGWRMRAVLDMNVYGADIATFRDKIHKSNWALQTMLHTITVSLSIQSHSSQQDISFKLDLLKSSIDEALRAALRPGHDFSHSLASDTRVARNLRNLAEAARHFHSAASSAASSAGASTARDSGVAGLRPNFGGPSSLLGDFPAYRRERVEMFIRDALRHDPTGQDTPARVTSPARVASPSPDSAMGTPRHGSLVAPQPLRISVPMPPTTDTIIEDDEDDEAEFERLFLDGLEDLAKDSIRDNDFDKAIELLKEAIRREETTSSDKEDFRRLQTQLALCHYFKDDWEQAEPIVNSLARSARSDGDLDLVVWTMLHALGIAHLSSYKFDSAMKLCKKALQGRKKWARANGMKQQDVDTCSESSGLLATIFQTKGDYIAAEIYRRQQPVDFVYKHPESALAYLSSHREMLEEVLGDDLPDFCDSASVPVKILPGFHELAGSVSMPGLLTSGAAPPRRQTVRRSKTVSGGDMSPLRTRRHQWEKFEGDTSKEVFVPSITAASSEVDADDEASSLASTPSASPASPVRRNALRRRVTMMFGSTRRRAGDRGRPGKPYREDDDDNSNYRPEPEQAGPTSSPIRRWFRGGNIFAARTSRTVLRKRPRDEVVLRPFGPHAPLAFHVLRRNSNGGLEDACDSDCQASCASASRSDSVSVSVAELAATAPTSSLAPTNCLADVPSTTYDSFPCHIGVLYADTFRKTSPQGHRRAIRHVSELATQDKAAVVHELPTTPWDGVPKETAEEPEIIKPMPSFCLFDSPATLARRYDWRGMTYLALPHWPTDGEEITALEARVREFNNDAGNSLAHKQQQQGTNAKPAAIARKPLPQKEMPPALRLQTTAATQAPAPITPDAAATLHRLVDILTTLSARKQLGPTLRRATKLELENLLSRLQRLNRDVQVCCDVQTAIDCLDDGGCDEIAAKKVAEDSGYESTSPVSSKQEAESSDEEGTANKPTDQPQQKAPVTPQTGEAVNISQAPLLKRQPSWILGDETAHWSSSGQPKPSEPVTAIQQKPPAPLPLPSLKRHYAWVPGVKSASSSKPSTIRRLGLSILTPVQEAPAPTLKRQCSWVKGDETAHRPSKSPAPQSPVMSPKKQVKWALTEDLVAF